MRAAISRASSRHVRFGHQPGQFLERLLRAGQRVEHGRFTLHERVEDRAAQFQHPLGVADQRVLLEDFLFLALNRSRLFQLLRAIGKKVDLLGNVLDAGQLGPPVLQRAGLLVDFLVSAALVPEMAESIQQIELKFLAQQGLVIVRPVHVDQQLADALQHLERDLAVVDQALRGAARPDDAADDQLSVLAGRQAEFLEDRVNVRGILQDETGFRATGVFARPDQRPVRALAEQQVERPDQDRFARARFAGDHVQARLKIHADVLDEGKVLDAERSQHRQSSFAGIQIPIPIPSDKVRPIAIATISCTLLSSL